MYTSGKIQILSGGMEKNLELCGNDIGLGYEVEGI